MVPNRIIQTRPTYANNCFSSKLIFHLDSQGQRNSWFIMNASNVTFDPSNMYSNNPSEKTSVINLVISQAPAGATSATVV
ncbi:unnamed protein product [Penicillium salamii]|nr:unnamed protein product [Penicillium salamii]